MTDLRVSVVVPAYNEGVCATDLLDKLFKNAIRQPDEVVVVDANSSDDTLALIKHWTEANKAYNVKIVELKTQAYPGRARNEGVKVSTCDYIAFIDCGLHPEDDWLLKLIEPFEQGDNVDVVWGKSLSLAQTPWEQAFAALVESCVDKDRKVVPSSCIKKSVFEQIGGFREDLRAAEDLLYIQTLAKEECKEAFVDAKAWYSGYPANLVEAFRKWSLYTVHTVNAGLHIRKMVLMVTELALYCAALVFGYLFLGLLGALGFLALATLSRTIAGIKRNSRKVFSFKEGLYAWGISVFIDMGRLHGMVKGLLAKKNNDKEV